MKPAALAFFVYIVASKRNGTLYTGHTDNLFRRICEHREGKFPGFTQRYGCKTLVWFEGLESRELAFRRERSIKEWRRSQKLRLIEEGNPEWEDLFDRFTFESTNGGGF